MLSVIMLSVTMLSVIMLSDIMLNVFMLSVVAPFLIGHDETAARLFIKRHLFDQNIF